MALALIAFFTLCALIRLYMWSARPKISWPKFKLGSIQNAKCKKDDDCSFSNYKCFNSECIKAESESCDANTGMWVKSAQGTLKCVCKKDSLITQSIDGGNCAVPVACGIYGKLNTLIPNPDYCDCDKGFKLDKNGLCIHVTDKDISISDPCPPDTISSTSIMARYYFDPQYLAQFGKTRKCLQVPCKTNVINGKPIKHGQVITRNAKDVYCLCAPGYGNYGVHLNVKHYLNGTPPDAPNACANIYEDEPEQERHNFSHYCYFYLVKNKKSVNPICFTTFYQLIGDGLVSQFKGNNNVTIKETWPYTHDQFILQTTPLISQDLKKWYSHFKRIGMSASSTTMYSKNEGETQVQIPDCSQTPNNNNVIFPSQSMNNIFYKKFVCHYTGSNPLYKNTVIVNPRVVEIQNDDANFANGYELYRSWGKWKIIPSQMNIGIPVENLTTKLLP